MDQKPIEVKEYDQGQSVEEFAIGLDEIGSLARSTNYSSNADILTIISRMDLPTVDFMGLLVGELNVRSLQNILAGMAMMINHLILENRYLAEEIQSLKDSGSYGKPCLNSVVFDTANIRNQYNFEGADDIPQISLNKLADEFNINRHDKTVIDALRRFIKYLMVKIIPKESHRKFTLRERGGYNNFTELPDELSSMIQKSVNLLEANSDEDRRMRMDLKEQIFDLMKQEIRRNPRKPKARVPKKLSIE